MSTITDFPAKSSAPVVWDWRTGLHNVKAQALYQKAVSEQWQANQLD
ncbi:MAG: hypothetical protein ACXWJK_09380 [Burkholderiaceae bacterium]